MMTCSGCAQYSSSDNETNNPNKFYGMPDSDKATVTHEQNTQHVFSEENELHL